MTRDCSGNLQVSPEEIDVLKICPTCASTNSIRDITAAPPGGEHIFRELRCDACQSQWLERVDPVSNSRKDITGRAVSSKSSAVPAGSRPKRLRPARVIAPVWSRITAILVVICIFGSGWAALAKREALVRHVPQTAGLFKTIGLPVNVRGLALTQVKARFSEENGQKVVTLEGFIHNITGKTINVPSLRISLRGADDREVYFWTAETSQNELAPGGDLPFRTRLASPPTNAQSALVHFANAQSAILR